MASVFENTVNEGHRQSKINRSMIADLSKQFDFLRGRVDAIYIGLGLNDKGKKKKKRGPRKNP